jgi:hypothetical protein
MLPIPRGFPSVVRITLVHSGPPLVPYFPDDRGIPVYVFVFGVNTNVANAFLSLLRNLVHFDIRWMQVHVVSIAAKLMNSADKTA